MDNTNIKELSEFEEYKNGLYKSAMADETLSSLLSEKILLDQKDDKLLDSVKFMANVLLPLTRSMGYILFYRVVVSYISKLDEMKMLSDYSRLTYEDFYDSLIILPKYIVKKILGELNCSTSIFENLLSFTYNLHKTEAIDTLRNNGIDITLASKKLMILTLSEQYNMSLQKFNNSEVSFEEFFHYMEGRMAYQIDGLDNYKTESIQIQTLLTELIEKLNLIEKATNENELSPIVCEMNKLIKSIPDKCIPFLCFYWEFCDYITAFEKEVLDEILKRDLDYYAKLSKYYEDYHNLEPLELPLGIFEEELNDIYNKIEKFCPRGQNFTALFGYGRLSPIVWTGDWNALSYFLKVLYGGRLENGFITIKQDVPKHMWDKAFKLFVDENNKHPSLNTLKTKQIAYLQELGFAREINYIFKNVFENIETRKN